MKHRLDRIKKLLVRNKLITNDALTRLYGFHSVATKYLANYMDWFKWLPFFNTEKDTVKTKHLLVPSHTSHSDTKLKDFKIREAIYILR